MFRLMLVTDRNDTAGRDLVAIVRAAVEGGVDCVQVREKDLDDGVLTMLVERVLDAVARRAAVVVNGRPSVAGALGVGLHLAEGDPLPGEGQAVERRLHPLGRSVHSVDGAVRVAGDRLDYLLLGTINATTSKPGLVGSGATLIRYVAEAVGPLPVMAIGGFDASNAGEAVLAGACGVAVRSALLRARDPARAAEGILRAMDEADESP